MRLVRYGNRGNEKPGILDGDGRIRDLSGIIPDIQGATLSRASIDRLRATDLARLPLVDRSVRLGPCVGAVPNVICIGLNYLDHAEEAGLGIPSEPPVFNKHTSALAGPNDAIICPPGSEKLDYEVELAFVIGTPCWHVSESDALNYVAGYFVCNDVSERRYQLEMGGQWTKGKSYPSFAPIGPWLVTSDEVPDPQKLELFLDVNGERRQTGTTQKMIFSVAYIVSYLSRFMSLAPGDVISTGTPPGVGLGRKPPVFLKTGDTLRLGIAGLGEQNATVVAFTDNLRSTR